ncbi:hypothetical protein V6N12_000009 [Hibiscus sabdariffa]|uniref:Homeobox-leucine zipper protein n=1 Tax=Hibiscus sabdariffa TaxID=183260 RepID=A0ABR2AIN0_9ROSI
MTGSNTQVSEYAYDPCGNNHEFNEVNVVGPELNAYMVEDDQPPIASTQMLYNRLGASSKTIWPGSNESKLSVVSELIHLKAQYRIPNACYDDLCRIMQRLMPKDNVMPKNIYKTKKLVRDMGLPVQKTHRCRNGCMIYWGCDSELSECKFCGHPRYKDNVGEGSSNRKAYKKMYYFSLTPRLQSRALNNSFELGNKLDPERKLRLSKELGLKPRQIAIWFQNMRARCKNKQLEKDYDALKKPFEVIKADNHALQAQNKKLTAEVNN